jgi:hypothetical protein
VGMPHLVTRAKVHVIVHVKCSLFLSDLKHNWNLLTNFSETSLYQNSRKFVQPFSGYRRTNRTILTGASQGWELAKKEPGIV